MKRRSYFVIFPFLLIFLFSQKIQTKDTQLTVHQVIAKMGETYKNCKSYMDIGLIEQSLIVNSGEKYIMKSPFKTYFTRPNFFRFEWKHQIHPEGQKFLYVVWSNGNETYTYNEPDKFRKNTSLEAGIMACAGISKGGSITVPLMLINQEKSIVSNNLIEEALIREERINETECYVIQGKHRRTGSEYTLWIGKNNFLLKKSRREMKLFDSTVITEEIHQKIEVDVEISKDIFDFKQMR